MNARCIGIQGSVTGTMRNGGVRLLYGLDPMTTHCENGVVYKFDVTKCMFSSGNGTERSRIARLVRNGDPNSPEVIVDMFCGIGYFTLPLLLEKANVSKLFACDINEEALEFLKQSAVANGVVDEVLQVVWGDSSLLGLQDHQNAAVSLLLSGSADRILLGLIPSSRIAWRSAARLLNKVSGGILHIHGVSEKDALQLSGSGDCHKPFSKFAETVRSEIDLILNEIGRWTVSVIHVECVKSYSPRKFHCVVDLKARPTPI